MKKNQATSLINMRKRKWELKKQTKVRQTSVGGAFEPEAGEITKTMRDNLIIYFIILENKFIHQPCGTK